MDSGMEWLEMAIQVTLRWELQRDLINSGANKDRVKKQIKIVRMNTMKVTSNNTESQELNLQLVEIDKNQANPMMREI